MAEISNAIDEYLGREVVIDVTSSYVFVGTLTGRDDLYVVLEDADAHDLRDTKTTRELYLLDTRRHGIRTNRKRVLVRVGEIVSLSALEEVEA